MRGISTLNLLLKGSLFTFSIFLASHSYAQAPDLCSEITANFDLNASGFSSPDNSFQHTIANGDGFFAKSFSRDINIEQTFQLLSPKYANPSPSGSVVYGFTLSGYVQGTDYQVDILDGSGAQIVTSGRLSVNPNQNANNQNTRVCGRLTADVNLLPGGGAVQYRITIFSPDPRGNGGIEVTVEFDDFSVGNIAGTILPVNFTGFRGKKIAKGTELAWNVADEVNVSRYEVQKGSDAANLKTIGIVFAGEKSTYTFTDEQPTQGVTFYRIRSVDTDGKYKFSTVISFSNGKTVSLLRAFPMPARNQVTLQHGTIEGKAQITISSESGQIMKRVVPAVGSMQTAIDLSALKAGMYLLRLENNNGEVETLKVVKQ
jgi:hypothetical protein